MKLVANKQCDKGSFWLQPRDYNGKNPAIWRYYYNGRIGRAEWQDGLGRFVQLSRVDHRQVVVEAKSSERFEIKPVSIEDDEEDMLEIILEWQTEEGVSIEECHLDEPEIWKYITGDWSLRVPAYVDRIGDPEWHTYLSHIHEQLGCDTEVVFQVHVPSGKAMWLTVGGGFLMVSECGEETMHKTELGRPNGTLIERLEDI